MAALKTKMIQMIKDCQQTLRHAGPQTGFSLLRSRQRIEVRWRRPVPNRAARRGP